MRLESLTATDSGGNPLLKSGYPLYDEVGNIITRNTEHGTYTSGYDALSCLTSADNPALRLRSGQMLDDESYTDNVGNRLTAAGVAGTWITIRIMSCKVMQMLSTTTTTTGI